MDVIDTEDSAPSDDGVGTSIVKRQRSGTVSRRDMAGSSLAVSSAATDALVAKARADVEARWMIALRCPRNLDDVEQEMRAECSNPDFAKAAIYARPVGGDKIAEGLSIRFAEMAVRVMGNVSVETFTIFDDDAVRITRVTVTDFETNATWSKDLSIRKTVERKHIKKGQKVLGERLNSYGDRVYIVEATDDDVNVKESNAISKAARTGALRLVPGGLQRKMLQLCKSIVADKAAKDPDGERKRMLDAFGLLRVMPSDLEEFLGHPTTQIVAAEVEKLRAIYNSIADGETTWHDVISAIREARSNNAAPASAAPTNQPAQNPPPPANGEQPKPETRKRGSAGLKESLKNETKPAEPAPSTTPAPAKEPTLFDKAAADARAKDAERQSSTGGEPPTFPCVDCGVPVGEPNSRCDACANA